jgi:hypothetical protein
MPANRTLNPERARWASLSYWHPDSPDAYEAGRTFFFAKAIADLQESLTRSPLPFTAEQRKHLTDLLVAQ